MNDFSLPGPGDSATWGNHRHAIGSPEREDDSRDPQEIDEDLAEVREWIEEFASAINHGWKGQAEQIRCLIHTKLVALEKECCRR